MTGRAGVHETETAKKGNRAVPYEKTIELKHAKPATDSAQVTTTDRRLQQQPVQQPWGTTKSEARI